MSIDVIPSSMFSLPRLGPTVLSSTNFIGAAKAAAPDNAVIIQFTMFMNDPSLKKLISDLAEGNEITSS